MATRKKQPQSKSAAGVVGGYRSQLTDDGTVILKLDRILDEGVRRGDRLEVRYLREDPNDPTSPPIAIQDVRLVLPHGATPSDIRRFAWLRWLAVAEAVSRWRADDETASQAITNAGTNALRTEGALRARRPGRRGHTDAFYKEIAERYVALIAQGIRAPRKALAAEMNVSPDTVAGWLAGARERGYLQPPGKRRRT